MGEGIYPELQQTTVLIATYFLFSSIIFASRRHQNSIDVRSFSQEISCGYIAAVRLLPQMGTAGTVQEKKIAQPIGQLLTQSGSCGYCTRTLDKSVKCATLGIFKYFMRPRPMLLNYATGMIKWK